MKNKGQVKVIPPSEGITLTIDEAFELALKLHQTGSLDKAEMLYRRIIDTVPDHLDALHFCGVLCHQQNRKQDAAGLIGRITEIDPGNADAHNNLGNVLEGLGRAEDAEACYRKAIALKPDHAPALNNLGVVLMARRGYKEAFDVYRRAVELSPQTADYHYNLANALRKCGQTDAAVDAYRNAVELDPNHLEAWQGLSRTLIWAHRQDEALQVFDTWLEKDPGNPTALYLKAACRGEGAPDRTPEAYVQNLFDDMADSFDSHLKDKLDYRAPQLLTEALATILPAPDALLDILDAGCGTGLCGPLLKPYARRLVGVDLSAGMLLQAKSLNIYDELVQAELTEYLKGQTAAFDLIVSADTLCYFGDLEPVLKGAAKALRPGGILACTLEDAGDINGNWQLNWHVRYAHGKSYVAQVLIDAGFEIKRINSVILRKEGGAPVNGHLVVAAR